MDDGDIKQLMQEIEFVLKRNQNEKYLRAIQDCRPRINGE